MKTILSISVIFLLPIVCAAQFGIGTRTITYNDPSRNNRAIECDVHYPAASTGNNVAIASGEFPIIIFGHGFAMQVGAYPNFWNEYVPQGYIMVFPKTEGGTIFPPPDHAAFGEDLKFLASQMQTQNSNSGSPFYQAISPRTAIMGHSMGGGASFLGSSNFSGVDCVIGLAPAETDPSAIAAAANISAPVLVFSGSSDGVTPPDEHHIPIYNASGSDCKYFVSIENGSHCYFASNTVTCTLGEIVPGSLPAEDQRQVTYAVLTPWLEYFLKDDCDSWNDFETALATESNLGTVTSSCSNDAPSITDNGTSLESDSQSNYQWYLNGTEIPNADQQTYTYSQSGMYQVGTVNIGNCPTLSNEINVQITGIGEVDVELIQVGNSIQISVVEPLTNATVEWFDLSGKLLHSEEFKTISSKSITAPQVRYNSGILILRLTSNETQKTWKLANLFN